MTHTFTRSDIYQAKHFFSEAIKKYFGEVWNIKSDGEYKGVSWDCTSPLTFDMGIWNLCQMAKHKGAQRAAGRIEEMEQRSVLRFILFYEKKT